MTNTTTDLKAYKLQKIKEQLELDTPIVAKILHNQMRDENLKNRRLGIVEPLKINRRH